MSNYLRIWDINARVYVDSFSGDDILGDGSNNKPYKSINRATIGLNQNTDKIGLVGYFNELITDNRFNTISVYGNAKKINYPIINCLNDFGGYYTIENCIVLNNMVEISGQVTSSHIINTKYLPAYSKYSIFHKIDGTTYDNKFYRNIKYSYNLIKDMKLGISEHLTLPYFSFHPTIEKTILDDCELILNTGQDIGYYDYCLFRVNCKFFAINALGEQVRVDNDTMTASEKETAVRNFMLDDANKHPDTFFVEIKDTCKFTDNKIVNVSDDPEMVGKDFNYSLIIGDPVDYPALTMDEDGSYIGPMAPGMNFKFVYDNDPLKNIEDEFEFEIPNNSGILINPNGTISIDEAFDPPFNGIDLISKSFTIPEGWDFNDINFPFLPGDSDNSIHVTTFDDFLDKSEANKIIIPEAGVTVIVNRPYLVKIENEIIDDTTYVEYMNNRYYNNDVIQINSAEELLTSSAGTIASVYPILRPTLIKSIKFKIFPYIQNPPSDFLTNDELYPWYHTSAFSEINDKIKSGFFIRKQPLNIYGNDMLDSDGKPISPIVPNWSENNYTSSVRLKREIVKRVQFKISLMKLY